MPHNIERSAFRPGTYIGYGSGFVWRIQREGHTWAARTIDVRTPRYVRGDTLESISAAIKAAV